MPTQTPILGLYNPLDADDANTAVRVWRTADNAVLDAAVGTARQNLLTNPGFEVWQRGIGPGTASGAYTADRWSVPATTSTYSLSRVASTIGSAGYSAQIVYTHAGGGNAQPQQKVEDYAQLRARAVTFAVAVKATVAARVRAFVYDSVTGYTYSAYNVGTAEERLSVTATISATATMVIVGVYVDTGSCTVELNDATLVVGTVPLAYAPLHPADEASRCQRYYEVHGRPPSGVTLVVRESANGAGQYVGQWVSFATTKAGVPTVTKNGTWTLTNCSAQPTANNVSVDGYDLNAVSTAAGNALFYCDSSDDSVTSEWNP